MTDSFLTAEQIAELNQPSLETRFLTDAPAPPTDEPGLVIDDATGVVLVVLPGGRRVAAWATGFLPPTDVSAPVRSTPVEGALLTLNDSLIPIWRGAKSWP